MKATKKQREAVARAIETLASFALIDTQGSIRALLDAFPGVEDETDETTRATLKAIGILKGEQP